MTANIPDQKHVVERIRAKYPDGGLDRLQTGRFLVELCQEIGPIPGAGMPGLHFKGGDNSATTPDGTTVNAQLILFEDGHMFDTLGKKAGIDRLNR